MQPATPAAIVELAAQLSQSRTPGVQQSPLTRSLEVEHQRKKVALLRLPVGSERSLHPRQSSISADPWARTCRCLSAGATVGEDSKIVLEEDPEKRKQREKEEAERKRREQDSVEFQSRFDLSPTELLLEDYSCAHTMTGAIYQVRIRSIEMWEKIRIDASDQAAGSLYLSKNYMCFYSPFFAKLLRINLRKLVEVEKEEHPRRISERHRSDD